MTNEQLAEVIEHLEIAKDKLYWIYPANRADQVFHDSEKRLDNIIKSLQNELHYAEIEKLATWKKSVTVTP